MTIRIDGTNTTANPGITGADTDTGLQLGTNEIELVTGGTNRATVESNGNFTIEDGNLVVASGHGIDFSATANGSSGTMDNELFDDYEKGTFNLTVANGTISGPAVYIKIGDFVQCWASASSFSDRTTSAAIAFSNLPFTPNSSYAGGTVFSRYTTQPSGGSWSSTYVRSDGTMNIYAQTSGNFTLLQHDDLISASTSIYLLFCYFTA